jgi:CubicO group peptidase (beta-lactamase class C family)
MTGSKREGGMKRVLNRFLVLALLAESLTLTFAGCGSNSFSPPQPQPQQMSLGATVDGLAQTQMQQYGIPAITVALAKQGSILYTQAYGMANLTSRIPAQFGTIFEIGSITKQFTAALIMLLQQQGKLHLDDPIASYLPQYGFSSAITIRMLLNHTSGLADYTNFPQLGDWVKNGVSEQTVLTAINQAGLQFSPGTQYQYSSSNYFALGIIIENLTNQPYAANLQQYIFQPLGLSSTYYALPPADLSAVGYTNNGSGLVAAQLWNRSAGFAAGALSSNVSDLVAWDNALISGKVVSSALFQQMTTPNGFVIDSQGDSYGFGLVIGKYNGRPIVWHTGQIGGFYAENVIFLDDGFTVVVLTNDQDIDTDPFTVKILNAVCNSQQLASNC